LNLENPIYGNFKTLDQLDKGELSLPNNRRATIGIKELYKIQINEINSRRDMKKESLLLTVTAIIIFGCNGNLGTDYSYIYEDVGKLISEDDKRSFLEQVYKDDQKVRDNEKEAKLVLKYGKDSKEHMEFSKALWKQDEINLKKVDAYFERFGYPSKATLGRDAAIAPFFVIHHSTNTGVRNFYFEILYKAYLSGDIDDTAMSIYLGRTYKKTFGERHQMENPYRSEDQINELIRELGLEEKKEINNIKNNK